MIGKLNYNTSLLMIPVGYWMKYNQQNLVIYGEALYTLNLLKSDLQETLNSKYDNDETPDKLAELGSDLKHDDKALDKLCELAKFGSSHYDTHIDP